MKMNIRQIFLGARLLVRLCLPATVFIGLCTGIFIAFIAFLQFLENITRDERFFGGSWLSLLIFYIIAGVALIRFNARLIHSSFTQYQGFRPLDVAAYLEMNMRRSERSRRTSREMHITRDKCHG